MRILIINLTRFGDLLQSQSVIRGLREQGNELGVVCLQNFAPAVSFLDGVSSVSPLPGGDFLAALDRGWSTALGYVHAWAEAVHCDFRPDAVLNLTSTIPARLLARLLCHSVPGNPTPRGFSLDEHGFGISGSAWTAFFEASTRKRGCSPFNIVDVFARASGLPHPAGAALKLPEKTVLDAAGERLHTLAASVCAEYASIPEPKGYVGFQLGASDPKRQWPAHCFAEIGKRIVREFGMLPVLLGTASEGELARQYLAQGAPGIDLTGRTSLTELAAVLRHTRLLLTNDTGTMHLAAGMGVDCLAIFLATAQPWDTGPYRSGCCSLEPALSCHPCGFDTECVHTLRCLEQITPATVWPLIQGRLTAGRWHCPPETAAVARVWEARPDASGYMDLLSLSGHEADDRTVWIRLQRKMYRSLLDTLDGSGQSGSNAAASEVLEPVVVSPAFLEHTGAVLNQADTLLHLLMEQGRLTLMQPSDRHGRQFLVTCQRIGALFDGHDPLNALGRLWHTLSQEKGAHLPDLLEFGAELRACLQTWRGLLCCNAPMSLDAKKEGNFFTAKAHTS